MEEMIWLLDLVQLTHDKDLWIWNLDSHNLFLFKSAHIHINEVLLDFREVETRWNKYIFIKVNMFIWCVLLNMIPTRINLVDKDIDLLSMLCNCFDLQTEDVKHVFFTV